MAEEEGGWWMRDPLDARAVLYDPQAQPPRRVRPLSSLHECRFLLPPTHADYLSHALEEQRQRERAAKREAQAFRRVAPAPPQHGPPLLEQLAAAAVGTVMADLREWRRVRVHLRDWGSLKSSERDSARARAPHTQAHSLQ